MKARKKLIKEALQYMTQCILLPGVEMDLDNVFNFYKENWGSFIKEGVRRNITITKQ
ncbi:MAG: hypothetical protein JWQ96_3087 [Segetibacter sp.]|nr:hypothetical protein [Segetibacter sp.]